MDERVLAERLITYDTSNVEGLRAAAREKRSYDAFLKMAEG